MKVTINADDFGISPGVNQTIEKMFAEKKLNSASLICGCEYFNQAVQIAKKNPDLKIGLHFNLTSGNAICESSSLLTNPNNFFKNSFTKIFLLAIFKKKKFLLEVKNELEAQIKLLKQNGINISHIDGHRHIHYIPGIFEIVATAAKKHNIPQVRIINENIFSTWKINYKKSFLWNGGIIKWLILVLLGLINDSRKLNSQRYFFSILYTCEISKELISKINIPEKYNELEIMIHPGDPKIDILAKNLAEKAHLLSKMRFLEQL